METKNITKIYVYNTNSKQRLTKDEINYLVMSNKCFTRSILKLTKWNWLVGVEYDDYDCLKNVLNTKEVRGKQIVVKRVFKSLVFRPNTKQTTIKGFIVRNIMGIEDVIKVPIYVKVITNTASFWQHEMVTRWQEMLDNPKDFTKAKIKPLVDIRPDGELEFVLAGGKKYLITYFNKPIDDYTKKAE